MIMTVTGTWMTRLENSPRVGPGMAAVTIRCVRNFVNLLSAYMVCVHACACAYIHICAHACVHVGKVEVGISPLELELQIFWGSTASKQVLMCVLGSNSSPNISELSPASPPYLLRCLTEPRAHSLAGHGLMTSRDPPLSAAPVLGSWITTESAFLCGC